MSSLCTTLLLVLLSNLTNPVRPLNFTWADEAKGYRIFRFESRWVGINQYALSLRDGQSCSRNILVRTENFYKQSRWKEKK